MVVVRPFVDLTWNVPGVCYEMASSKFSTFLRKSKDKDKKGSSKIPF